MRRVVVVGAGHAGGTLVGLLRQGGFAGEIVLLGAEPELPYHRPPLSKAFMRGELEQWLRPAEAYPELGVAVRLSETVIGIDRATRTVRTSNEVISYDVLVLATGATPRRLPVPGADLAGVQTLRTLEDARQLRKAVTQRAPLVIVGGGYVGLEVAAVARAEGTPVTVLEREDRLLPRTASPALSGILTDLHQSAGTQILTGVEVTGFAGSHALEAVALTNGRILPCASVLVGVGARPNDHLMDGGGAGISVDAGARTSDPHVLAIGDVTRRPAFGAFEPCRLESIPSAVEQARQAAATILGTPLPRPEVPWFWSDQGPLKLKIAGLVRGEHHTVTRGNPTSGSFALFHHRDGRLVAAEAANAASAFMAARRWIADGKRINPARAADPAVGVRDLVES
jgi:3-phenylpropionate/trans-cinnamate dioxygenase ferredoxin reductase subunit